MRPHIAYSICAGLLAGLLYIISITGIVTGVFVMALPFLPLLWTAFRYGGQAITIASIASGLFVLGLAGFDSTLVYLALIALPSWIYGTRLMHVRVSQNMEFLWFPIGLALTYASAYFAGAIIVLEWLLSTAGESIFDIIQNDLAKAATGLNPQMAEMITTITRDMPYVILAAFVWLWIFLLYAASMLAHFECFTRGKTPRSHMALQPFMPPLWLPASAAGLFILSLSGDEKLSFIMLAGTMVLLVPYFFCGIANIQQLIIRQTNPRAWRIGLFFLLVVGGWPILLIITIVGIYHHLSNTLLTQTT